MASGFGVTGARGRCYAYWRSFANCVEGSDDNLKCNLEREDYLECLHHMKQTERAKRIEQVRRNQTSQEAQAYAEQKNPNLPTKS